jgi:PAS domain S-box-containing protein
MFLSREMEPLPGRPTHDDLHVLVDAMSAAVMRCSRDLRYVWASRAYAAWLGRRPDEIAGRCIVDVIGADALAAIHPYIQRVLSGERVEYEERVPFSGIGDRWIHAVYAPIYAEAPQPTGWVGVVRDVSDERQHEVRLRDSEFASRWLAAIVESSDDAIVSKNLEGIITSWNRGAERMFGYTAADAVGRSIRLIIPDERHVEESMLLETIRRGGSLENFETVRRRKDGSRLTISLTVSPVRDGSGAIVGASKIARDVTEQRRAASQTAFLAEAGVVMAASLDYETTLKTIANLAVPAIADWCAVDVVRDGKLARLAVAHVDPAKIALAATIRERYEDPESPNSPSGIVRTGRGVMIANITDQMIVAAAAGDEERVRLVRMLGIGSYICVPLVAHGQTLGALTLVFAESGRSYTDDDFRFAQDIAYRAALAVDNAHAYDQVQRANRLKDEFLATLSHELRTPLNAILGYSRMIRSGMMTTLDKQARAIETVERNATSLTQIVEDVLDVSRIVAGKLRLDVQAVELPRVVEQAVESILPAANAKGVRVQTVLDPRATPISGDPERLQQVVWNLVSNAVKFTPRGGQVQVRVERVNSHVELIVSDTGIGITQEFLPHIFERFRQADAGSTRAHGGLGLGLAITRHLIELHGGTVHASSAGQGTGATFRVTLPVMIVHPAEFPERRVHPRDARAGSGLPVPDLQGVHVLAIDDDADALAMVREILETTGAQVATVDSARSALEMLDRSTPDVLIADLGMPEMDGFELIAQVRKSASTRARSVPAAALTAYARSEDRAKALRLGFQMHLAKPIDPAELMAAVAALANRNTPE